MSRRNEKEIRGIFTMNINEFKELDTATLKEKVEQLRKELFRLRINASTAHVKDYSQFEKLRKNIARALTVISQKESLGKVL